MFVSYMVTINEVVFTFHYALNFEYNQNLIFDKEFKDLLPLNKLISYFKDLAEIKFNLDALANIKEKELLQNI